MRRKTLFTALVVLVLAWTISVLSVAAFSTSFFNEANFRSTEGQTVYESTKATSLLQALSKQTDQVTASMQNELIVSDKSSINPFSVSNEQTFQFSLRDMLPLNLNPQSIEGTPMPIDVVNDLAVKMNLSVSGLPILGHVAHINLVVEPEVDAPNTEVYILLPKEFSLVSGSLQWTGNLSKNKMVQLNAEVEAVSVGISRLEAVAVSKPYDSYPQVSSTHCYVSIAQTEDELRPGVLEDITQIEAIRLNETENTSNENVTPLSPGTVTVYGYWYYYDQSYTQKPCRYARVELWDGDFPSDVKLLTTYVQSNGYYQFPAINNDDGLGQDGYDVYVKVFCDSDLEVYVTDGISTYWSQTDKHDNVPDGYHYMGSYVLTGDKRGCFGIYDNIVDEFWWLYNKVSWYRSEVLVRWPYETWPHSHGNTIDVPSGWEWNRMMALHEYAHCIHYAARGGSWPPGGGPDPHYIYSESSGGFAIAEGWAEFMQCAVDNRGDYGFGTGESIESNSWADYIDSTDWDGNIVEGSVASIFWDIFDGVSSSDEGWGDYINQEFSKLWTVFLNDDPNDMETYFWNGWKSRYGVGFNEWSIFYGSRINKDTTPPSNPTSFTSSHTPNVWSNDNTIDITWYGASDDLSGVYGYSYVWSNTPTQPDTTVDTTSNSFTSPPLSSGDWYCCIRTRDKAGNWYPGYSYNTYPFKIDITPPNNPSSYTSSPVANVWSNDNTIDITWYGASDAHSGVYGYSYVWSNTPTQPDTTVDTTSNSFTSPPLSDGEWYCCIRTRDNVGNWFPTYSYNAYPFKIDKTPPSAPVISSSTHPNQDAWYSNNDPSFTWTTPSDLSGIAGYSYILDQISSTTPDEIVDTTGNSKSYIDVGDGEWYFHVRAKDNAGNWGPPGHYRIRIARSVNLESRQDNGATSNLGTITFDGIPYSLPVVVFKVAGTYQAQYNPPSATYTFDHWETTGGVSVSGTTSNPTTVTVSGDGILRAIYKAVTVTFTISLESRQDTGATSNLGTITFDGIPYSLPTSVSKPAGSYQALYNPASGYTFVGWETSGSVSVSSSTDNPTTVTITGDGTLKAVFSDTTPPIVNIIYPIEGAYLNVPCLWVNGTVTEDNKGTLEPYINDTHFGLFYWDADAGNFAFNNRTAIHDGSISVKVSFTDVAGNTGSDTVSFILDTTSPTVVIITPITASPICRQTPTTIYISYNYTDLNPKNVTIKVHNVTYIIGEMTITTLNAGTNINRNDSVLITAASDGAYNVTIIIYDLADNCATVTQINAVIIDNTPSNVTLTSPADGSYVRGVVWVNATILEVNPCAYVVAINGTPVSSGSEQVSWQWDTTAYADGVYVINVTATDAAGNVGSSAVTVTVDNTIPEVQITYPGEGEYLDSVPTIWINGTVTELNKGALQPSINDTRFSLTYWNSATGVFAFSNNTAIPDSMLALKVSFTDLAGKTGEATVWFTIDTVYPVVTITYPIEGHYFDGEAAIWVNGTFTEKNFAVAGLTINHTGFALVNWTWNSATYAGTFAFKNNSALADATYHVKVSITDLAGKTGYSTVTFTVDTVPPVVNITYPSEGANVTISQTIWVNGTVTELNKGAAEPAISDVRFNLTYWNPATGEFAFSNNTAILASQTLYFAVNFTDLAGKTGLDDVQFNLILPLPQLQLKGVTGWYWFNDTTITSVVQGDVDGDGSNETVTGGYYNDGTRTVAQLAVWNGSTLALEGVRVWYWVGDTIITSVAIGDVDGDGQMEIVTAGYYHDGVHKIAQLAVWDGATLSLEGVTVWYWVGDTCISSVVVGDVDADGAAEIVTAGYYNDGVRDVAQLVVWDGQTLSLEGVTVWYWVGDTTINSVAIGDVDGDGFSEIVTGGYYNDGTRDVAQLAVWNGSTPVLERVTVWYWVGDTRINSVAVGDVDGDASVEIVTGGYYNDGVKIAQLATWDGATLSLEDVTVWNWVGDTTINSVAVGDVDGDGQIEIVTGGNYHDGTYDNAQLVVWKGSDLTLETVTGWYWVGDTRINSVAVGDVDNDGHIEIITGGSYHDGTRTVAQLTVWAITSD